MVERWRCARRRRGRWGRTEGEGKLSLGSLSGSGVEFPRVGLELYWGFEAFVSERLFDLTLQSTARTKHKFVSLHILLASLQGLVSFLSLTGQIRQSHLLQALKP